MTLSTILPDPLVAPLDDTVKAIELVADVLDETKSQVCERLIAEEKNVGHYQQEDIKRLGIEPHIWTDELAEFYKQTHMGIVGNVVWNRRPEKLELRSWMGEFIQQEFDRPCRILTIGDGAGYDSLYLSLCGHQVTYSEESQSCIAFASRIFEDSQQDIRIVDDHKQIENETFDLIVCLDVLEHVPDPPSMVRSLTRQLETNGRLIVHAPFFFLTEHNPTHLNCNRKYSGDSRRVYEANGLVVQKARFFWDPVVLSNRQPDKAKGMDRLKIFAGGTLLKMARYWNWPHNQVALKTVKNSDPKWLDELMTLRDQYSDGTDSVVSPWKAAEPKFKKRAKRQSIEK